MPEDGATDNALLATATDLTGLESMGLLMPNGL